MSLSQNYPTTRPTLTLDFAKAKRVDPRVTFTRASTATYFDASGTLRSAANNAPRIDFNPSTLAAQGFLIEEARTNGIRNNTMVGAVAGTPGTVPTNWGTGLVGLTQEVVGTGTEAGINYIDVRFSGTATGTQFNVFWETTTGASTLNGITYTSSVYWKIAAGSLTNISSSGLNLNGYDSGGAFLSGAYTAGSYVGSVVPSATLTRLSRAYTGNNASLAFGRPGVFFTTTVGAAIDITIRIGLPQLEQGAFATSVIPTTTTALTRSADVASVNTLSPWYNAAASTVYAEWNTQANSVSRYLFEIQQNATSNNRVDVNINTSNVVNPRTVISGAASMTLAAGTYTAGTTAKIAFAYAQSDYASSLNGGSAVTSLAGNIPSSLGIMYLGSLAGSVFINGYLRRITYYPRRLSNAELVSITS
jgi:hypothetical protein